jgi:hypothetical protein
LEGNGSRPIEKMTQHLFQGSEEKHKKKISEYAVPMPKFEPSASRIHAYDIISRPVCLVQCRTEENKGKLDFRDLMGRGKIAYIKL